MLYKRITSLPGPVQALLLELWLATGRRGREVTDSGVGGGTLGRDFLTLFLPYAKRGTCLNKSFPAPVSSGYRVREPVLRKIIRLPLAEPMKIYVMFSFFPSLVVREVRVIIFFPYYSLFYCHQF